MPSPESENESSDSDLSVVPASKKSKEGVEQIDSNEGTSRGMLCMLHVLFLYVHLCVNIDVYIIISRCPSMCM